MKHSILSQTPQSLKLRFQLSPEESRLPGGDTLSAAERQQQVMQNALDRYLQAEPQEYARPPQLKLLSESTLGLSFACEMEFYPEVKLPENLHLKLDVPVLAAPEQKEIQQALQGLQIRYGEQLLADRPAQWGDVVLIDTLATCLGQYLPGSARSQLLIVLDPAEKEDPFLAGLIGLSAGQKTEINKPLSADYPHAAWRGKPARYQVYLHQVRALRIPPAEVLPSLLNESNLESLLAVIFEELKVSKTTAWRNQIRETLSETLVAQSELTLPNGWVEGELAGRWKSEDETPLLKLKELPQSAEILKKGLLNLKMLPHLQNEASQALKTRLVLRAVAEREGITLEQPELEQLFQALNPERPVKEIVAQLKQGPELGVLLGVWLSGKVMNHLVSRAEIRAGGEVIQTGQA
jgi:trigger factor